MCARVCQGITKGVTIMSSCVTGARLSRGASRGIRRLMVTCWHSAHVSAGRRPRLVTASTYALLSHAVQGLVAAVLEGHADAVPLLVSAGADVNAPTEVRTTVGP